MNESKGILAQTQAGGDGLCGLRAGAKYRKTALIEAVQWFKPGDHPAIILKDRDPWCPTLEGGHWVTPGDWIATGIKGEHWPIKPDVFAATYELAASPGTIASDGLRMPPNPSAGEVNAEMLAALKGFLPKNVCLTNPYVPDKTVLPADVTIGELRAVAAVISRAEACAPEDGWKDIATAPKDGTLILAAHERSAFTVIWDEREGGWVDGSTDRDGDLCTLPATHWRHLPPLPSPPAQPGTVGEAGLRMPHNPLTPQVKP